MGDFHAIPTTTLADLLGQKQVMELGIRQLWPSDRVAGPAFTVRCPPGDSLMPHAAIYRADPGSVIVVESGDTDFAPAGGNVRAVAHRRGVEAFVLDDVIRYIGEIGDLPFPAYARGVLPIPGGKKVVQPHNVPVNCGGVTVHPGDIVIGDEDGVVVVPAADTSEISVKTQRVLAREAEETLDQWEAKHRARVDALLTGP